MFKAFQSKNINRSVEKRSIAKSVFYSIITMGLYADFWFYEITKETEGLKKIKYMPAPFVAMLLNIITFNIFGIYWAVKISRCHNEITKQYKLQNASCDTYVILAIFACIANVLSAAGYFYIFFLKIITLKLFIVATVLEFIAIILTLMMLGIMQSLINRALVYNQQNLCKTVYVSDNTIFNRPILSYILMFFMVDVIPVRAANLVAQIYFRLSSWPLLIKLGIFNHSSYVEAVKHGADLFGNCTSPIALCFFITEILTSLAILWWFKLRFKKAHYKGVLVRKGFFKGMLYAAPVLVFVCINLLVTNFNNFNFGILVFALIPAIREEVQFRGMVIPNFLRTLNRRYAVYVTLFLTSVVFSCAHLINLIAGAAISVTVYQLCYTFMLGIVFAVVVMKTGNLWPAILYHFAIDFLAFLTDHTKNEGLVETHEISFTSFHVFVIIICLITVLYCVWVCRPSKQQAIFELWDVKWGNAVINKEIHYGLKNKVYEDQATANYSLDSGSDKQHHMMTFVVYSQCFNVDSYIARLRDKH